MKISKTRVGIAVATVALAVGCVAGGLRGSATRAV